MTGVVTSNKMEKTVVVEVTRTYRHPCTKKLFTLASASWPTMKWAARIGDHVRIVESRPLLASKALGG
jgi:small subunit ribosomal protein S17